VRHTDLMTGDTPSSRPVQRLVGVYDADSTLRAELAYWIGARLGRRHCSLCDITHGAVRERPDWRAYRDGLPVPFDTYHRNDQPADVRAVAAGRSPVVVGVTATGMVVLLGPEELEACDGSIDRLVESLEQAVSLAGLEWQTA
jgi:hypothetical protein